MANQLLRGGGQSGPLDTEVIKMDQRTMLYRDDCDTGRIFNTAEEVEAAIVDGWVDSPDKIGPPDSSTPGDSRITSLGGGYYTVDVGGVFEKARGIDAAQELLDRYDAEQLADDSSNPDQPSTAAD